MYICPKCGSDATRRVRRSWWMRLFTATICMRCERCGQTSMMRRYCR